jgi:hypothetical protein
MICMILDDGGEDQRLFSSSSKKTNKVGAFHDKINENADLWPAINRWTGSLAMTAVQLLWCLS